MGGYLTRISLSGARACVLERIDRGFCTWNLKNLRKYFFSPEPSTYLLRVRARVRVRARLRVRARVRLRLRVRLRVRVRVRGGVRTGRSR